MGQATLDLLEEFPAYTDFLWERVRGGEDLRGRVLEVGCGIGSISRRILALEAVESLEALDIDPRYAERLAREVRDPRLKVLRSSAERLPFRGSRHDWAVSINVLEHVEDDRAALAGIARALRPGGRCLLLVPAHPCLYSSLDRGLSHHRRYTRARLRALAASAGLEVLRLVHFNPVGALGWWWNGRVLRRGVLPRGQVGLYARWGIPFSRWADRWSPFPFGISLIGTFLRPAQRRGR